MEESTAQIRLRDPLGESTRKQRRGLLGISTIALVVVHADMFPTKISALGIEFSQSDKGVLLLIFTAIVFYFVVAFLVYAAADFISWRQALRESTMNIFIKLGKELSETKRVIGSDETKKLITEMKTRETEIRQGSIIKGKKMFVVRVIFDFIIPPLIGIYALIGLLIVRSQLLSMP